MDGSTTDSTPQNGLSPGLLQMLRAKRQQQKAQAATANVTNANTHQPTNSPIVHMSSARGRGGGRGRGRGRGRGHTAGRGRGSPIPASNGLSLSTQLASKGGARVMTTAERLAMLQAKIAKQLSAGGTAASKKVNLDVTKAPATNVAAANMKTNADVTKASAANAANPDKTNNSVSALNNGSATLATQSVTASTVKASPIVDRIALLRAKIDQKLNKPALSTGKSKLAALEAKLAAKLPTISSKRSQPESNSDSSPKKRPRLANTAVKPSAVMKPRSLTSSMTMKKKRVASKREQVQLTEAEIAAQKKKDEEESYKRMQLLNEDVGLRDEYQLIKGLGQGRFGVVSLVEHKKTKVRLAIKELKYDFNEKTGFPIEALRELTVLSALQQQTGHKNIVAIREIVSGKDLGCWYLVMEYCEYDMDRLLQCARTSKPFSSAQIKSIMLQLFEGLRVMHDHWYVHRDIKVQNILIDSKGVVKYCDFGCARRFGSGTQLTPGMVSGHYRAPELLLRTENYDTAVDVWAVGCIFGELLSRCVLFPGKSEIDQIQRVTKLLGTPSEEEWPGFTRRAAKIGLRIESADKLQKSIESTEKPQKSPPSTSKVDKSKHSSTPAHDDPLASFMAQIENKTESLDESSTKDAEADKKEAESDVSDKEVVCSATVAEDGSPDTASSTHVADALASDGLQAQTDVASAAPSDGTVPIQNHSNSMEIQPSENTSNAPDVKVTKTVESKGLSAASLHAARVACAASRHKLRKAFPEDGYDPIHVHAANFRTTALTAAGFELLSSCLMYNPKTRISAAEAVEHRWFKNLPLPKNLTSEELNELKIRHQQTEAKAKQAEAAKQAADAIERARRMAMNIGRRRIAGLNPSLAATPGVIVYPPRPLLAPTFPAIQTKMNLALQQQMIVARTQQIQRHIASAQDRAKKEAAAKAEMMAEIMSLRNS